MKRDRYQQPPHDPSPEEVNFDLLRMQKAVDGVRFVIPERLPDEDFFEWMRETADKCRTK
jgi:hypothetical protein